MCRSYSPDSRASHVFLIHSHAWRVGNAHVLSDTTVVPFGFVSWGGHAGAVDVEQRWIVTIPSAIAEHRISSRPLLGLSLKASQSLTSQYSQRLFSFPRRVLRSGPCDEQELVSVLHIAASTALTNVYICRMHRHTKRHWSRSPTRSTPNATAVCQGVPLRETVDPESRVYHAAQLRRLFARL